MSQDNRILLTIYLEEGFHSRVEGQNFNKKRPKGTYETSDGVFRGRIPTQRNYVSYSTSRVRITTIPSQTVEYFQSKDSKPSKFCDERKNWDKMTPHQRLMYHLKQQSEGKRFEFSFVKV